ncbi:Single domain Von Willebrand factor type C domain, partial [Trinorchestia longiramus]
GNTILQRSGASGVCATPYGKMSVGQAIHWIGCRKIICRSERGFPHLLEKTCPPVPTNLPPGCTILHPSQTLPYPTCCPTPSCPPLGPRPPPTLTPASAKTRSKQTKKKPKASFFLSNGTPSVKIEENKGNVNVYEPEESSMKA